MAFTEYKRTLTTHGPIKEERIYGHCNDGTGVTIQSLLGKPLIVAIRPTNAVLMAGTTTAATISGKTITVTAPWNASQQIGGSVHTSLVLTVLGY
jgi:hypothetical protein